MITVKNIIAAIAIGTTALAAAGSAANAGDYRHGYGNGYGPRYHAPAYGRYAPPPRYYSYGHRRNDTGRKVATGVAIGVGALILGSIIANESRRNQGYYQGY